AVASPGDRNTTTIPPRVRREVLARDRHRCRAPGCERRRYLEVHHVVARHRGGSNGAENLVTLCSACHRVWHVRAPVG
ncbi:MAG: HNH endonuclease, partial [Krumholzibacteria bacterium]|nr:HNH endonuclease [Candidatus Krumholzibacteria bacterium]